MRELFKSFPTESSNTARGLILIDTCFLINLSDHQDKLKTIAKIKNLAMTSFNVEEIINIEHKVDHKLKNLIRKFLKKHQFLVVEIPVHPGDREAERAFVSEVDPNLLKKISDPSDAVLIATAIKTRSTVLTKDKHHLFTVQLENFIKDYGIKVYNNFEFLKK